MMLTAGTRFGSHDTVVLVGGSMSEVFGRDTNLWRDVAIKGARSWPWIDTRLAVVATTC